MWTILKLLNWTSTYFKNKGISTPRLDAEVLLAYLLNCERIHLYTNYEKPLTSKELKEFKKLVKRRAKREPLQYIVGKCEFWSLNIEVNNNVLIPRADTEIIVEVALKVIEKNYKDIKELSVLEIGIGSGAISIALAKEKKNLSIIGTDKSILALEVAKKNIVKYGLEKRITLIAADLFNSFKNKRYFHLIISNPPYISPQDFLSLQPEVKYYEPKSALIAKENGLKIIKEILTQGHIFLYPNGCLLIEIGFGQSEYLHNFIKNIEFLSEPKFYKDYSKIDRVLETFYKGENNG